MDYLLLMIINKSKFIAILLANKNVLLISLGPPQNCKNLQTAHKICQTYSFQRLGENLAQLRLSLEQYMSCMLKLIIDFKGSFVS